MAELEQPDSGKVFAAPPLSGRFVELRPPTVQDHGYLYAMEVGPELNPRWKYRGTTPSPEQWQRNFWDGVLVQYLVFSPSRAEPLGLVLAYKANFQDQYAYVGAARFAEARRSPTMLLGVALLINYAFHNWSFRKLYFDTPEYNHSTISSGLGRLLKEEARLREHILFGGQRWDQLTLALYRDDWERRAGRVLAIALAPAERRALVRMPGREPQTL